jgi:3-hydroxy-3-methylglutaryl CoA synthase
MAVAAAQDCIIGKDKNKIDAGYLCSTSVPYLDRQNAGIVATALNLRSDINTADFSSSQRAGTTGLLTALNVVKGGDSKSILVTAADRRMTRPAGFYEMWFGDGAASLMVGDEDVIAEFKGAYSVSYDFVDHFRGSWCKFDYTWEERWLREEGYSKIIPEAVNGLFKKLKITMDDVQKLVFPCIFKAEHRSIAKKLGASGDKLVDTMHEVCGETGAAHALLMFVSALETAKPGDGILLAGFGQGCDALYFKVTENITKLAERLGVKGSLARRNHGQLHEVPEVPRPHRSGDGHPGGSPGPDGHDGPLAEPQDGPRYGRRQVHGLRNAAVPAGGSLCESGLRTCRSHGRL